MYYRFIEIGTSDFGNIPDNQYLRDFDFGICVEPIFEYLNNVTKRPNINYVCAAIGDTDGTCEIQFIPPDRYYDDDAPAIPWILRGSNSAEPNGHYLLKSHYNMPPSTEGENFVEGYDYGSKAIRRTVPQISVKTFVEMYNIEGCEVLKLDCENMDRMIVKEFIKIWNSGEMDKPSFLQYEDVSHDQDLVHELIDAGFRLVTYNELNYIFTTNRWDETWGKQ